MPSRYGAKDHARRLTYPQRALLIRHMDNSVQIERQGNQGRAFAALIRSGILTDKWGSVPQRTTRLTEFGRDVLAALLADLADHLIAAGFSPMSYVRRAEEKKAEREPCNI